jgi:hypothetical protein
LAGMEKSARLYTFSIKNTNKKLRKKKFTTETQRTRRFLRKGEG